MVTSVSAFKHSKQRTGRQWLAWLEARCHTVLRIVTPNLGKWKHSYSIFDLYSYLFLAENYDLYADLKFLITIKKLEFFHKPRCSHPTFPLIVSEHGTGKGVLESESSNKEGPLPWACTVKCPKVPEQMEPHLINWSHFDLHNSKPEIAQNTGIQLDPGYSLSCLKNRQL